MTDEEPAEMERREKLEQKESYYKNQAEKNRRIAEHSLDGDNKKTYAHRAEQCGKKAAEVEKELEKKRKICYNKAKVCEWLGTGEEA